MHHVCCVDPLFLKRYVMDNLDKIFLIYGFTWLFCVLMGLIGVCFYG